MSSIEAIRISPVVERLRRERVMAILRRVPPADVRRVAEALLAGGIRVIEITLDSERPLETIAALRRDFDGRAAIAAGTVLSAEDAEAAVDAGAELCVAPDCNPDMVERALALGVPAVPGAFTATEIQFAWRLGASLVKLFPGTVGGPQYVRDVHAPLAHVPLLVTGGVDAGNARAFLDAGAAAVGAGSSLLAAADMTAAADALVAAVGR